MDPGRRCRWKDAGRPRRSDLVAIHPLPSYVWYEDMADFTELVSDDHAARRLARAINGRGAFRRFKDELHEEYPHLLPFGMRSGTPAPPAERSTGCSTPP